jgi:aspartate aminotransferase
MYSAEILADIGEVIQAKEAEFGTAITLVSDEPYKKLLFDGAEYPQLFPHHPRSIVATSHSKDLALAGERIGMVAVSPEYPDGDEVVDGLIFCNRTLGFVNAPALMQHIIARLQGVTVDVGGYEARRDLLYSALTDIGYSVVRPAGAFYMFPRSPIEDDIAFVDQLKEHRVLVVPGAGFGGPGHFRISFSVTEATLRGSLAGFREAFDAATG